MFTMTKFICMTKQGNLVFTYFNFISQNKTSVFAKQGHSIDVHLFPLYSPD